MYRLLTPHNIGHNYAELVSDDNPKDPLKKVKQQWANNPLLNQMPASKNDHVFFVDGYLWSSSTRGPITDELILEQLPQILSPLTEKGG